MFKQFLPKSPRSRSSSSILVTTEPEKSPKSTPRSVDVKTPKIFHHTDSIENQEEEVAVAITTEEEITFSIENKKQPKNDFVKPEIGEDVSKERIKKQLKVYLLYSKFKSKKKSI
jgi:carotenoid cleavage dioxygenase-like enzyme